MIVVNNPYGAPGFQTGEYSSKFRFVWATNPQAPGAKPLVRTRVPSSDDVESHPAPIADDCSLPGLIPTKTFKKTFTDVANCESKMNFFHNLWITSVN